MRAKRTCLLQEYTLYESIRTCLLQECTLYGVNKGLFLQEERLNCVNKDLSVRGREFIRGQKGLHIFKNARYMGSIRTSLLQDCTLYWVNNAFFYTGRDVIWGQ
jgi:hypothetical protein